MSLFLRVLCIPIIFWVTSLTTSAAPIVPGLAGKHPLTEDQVGRVLIAELRCAACHTNKAVEPLVERAAPDLTNVGSRVSPAFLKRMIANPGLAHHGTTMPQVMSRERPEERDAVAEAIAHYLIARSTGRFKWEAIEPRDAAEGKSLFHSLGCIACHSPKDENGRAVTREGLVDLEHIPEKYSRKSLAEFLFQPLLVRPSGRMPDMRLTRVEARAIASYLLVNADSKKMAEMLPVQDALVEQGQRSFERLNCAACHKSGQIAPAANVGDLQTLSSKSGCLGDKPGESLLFKKPSPWFNLSNEQKAAITAAMNRPLAAEDSVKNRLAVSLTTFNCIACHVRDDYGGVDADRNEFFRSSEKELGDEARIPPPLTLVGAKLKTTALKKMLFDADIVRPYMITRMPQFGEANLRPLPDWLQGDCQELHAFLAKNRIQLLSHAELTHLPQSRVNNGQALDIIPLPNGESEKKEEREREKQLRAAGRLLIGDQGLNCIACHAFNGQAPNKKGIDLMTAFSRLNSAWFYVFMIDPAAFRPHTVMPTSWPNGKAVQKDILNGSTDRQLEAIWYYLSLGTSAADPSGIRPPQTILRVTDAARVYRGRSSVAGFRGIAVGFPDKLSYAFNAETGTLSAIWKGDFIQVDRSGQGSGAFRPASPFVQLPQDLSFYRLVDETTAWPLRPVMTKEAPVNPDPLYPKNRGYQFKGYVLDDASVPTFQYRSGDIAVEDRSIAIRSENTIRLVRTLSLESPRQETLWMRVLTGTIQEESKQQYRTPGVRVHVPTAHSVVRPMVQDKNTNELLLRFEIPKGPSQFTLSYEPLP